MAGGIESKQLLHAGEGFEYRYNALALVAHSLAAYFVCWAVDASVGLTAACVSVVALACLLRLLLTLRVSVRIEDGTTTITNRLSTARHPGLPTKVEAIWSGVGNQAMVVALEFESGQVDLVRGIHLGYRRGYVRTELATPLSRRAVRVVERIRNELEMLRP